MRCHVIKITDGQSAGGCAVIRNFEEVKKQLVELSDVVNKFQSEQVQLKIVELVFQGAGVDLEQSDEKSIRSTFRR
jgi:hypothetical protein